MNRTLRKRKQPTQTTPNTSRDTRSSAAAAASAAESTNDSLTIISPANKRPRIEKEIVAVDIQPQEKLQLLEKTQLLEKSTSPEANETITTPTTTANKSKTPEPSNDDKAKNSVKEPSPPPKQDEKAKEVIIEEKVEKKQSPEKMEEEITVDPYESLSEADKKLFFTDIVGFLKRFTPKYHVPVYRTWSISKSATK